MNRLPTRAAALLLAATALAAPAAAGRRPVVRGATDLVRLELPATAGTLLAGGRVAIAWSPGAELATFPAAEEWELFVSLDGGRTWLARLTPHLALDRRAVTVRLPDATSDDMRFMVRVGDERVEREQLLPGRWRLVPAAAPLAGGRSLAVRGRGEAARPRDQGVTSWVEGGRDGRGWALRHGGADGSAWAPVARPAAWLLVAPLGPAGARAAIRRPVAEEPRAGTGREARGGHGGERPGHAAAPCPPTLCRWNV